MTTDPEKIRLARHWTVLFHHMGTTQTVNRVGTGFVYDAGVAAQTRSE